MADHHSDDPHAVGHIVSMRILVVVFVSLLVLTWITVASTYIDLGEFNFPLAMMIASVKAYLVVAYFMHLRWDKPFNLVVFLSSLAFVALFISFVMTDKHEYRDDEIENYAPKITIDKE